MKTKKLLLIIFASALFLCSVMLFIGCNDNKKELKFTQELKKEYTCGTEIYFKQYINFDYSSKYKLFASYYDCSDKIQVENKEFDSLMFKLENVSKYDFKIERDDGQTLSCSLNSIAVTPKWNESNIWYTGKGKTVVLNMLTKRCDASLKYEDAKIDPAYKEYFTKVVIKNGLVDGKDAEDDLKNKTDYVLEESAEYEFHLIAENSQGQSETVLVVNTMDKFKNSNKVLGYYFNDDKKLEFEIADVSEFSYPDDNGTVNVRFGDHKSVAKYNAANDKFIIENINAELDIGEKYRLYITDNENKSYSLLIVRPDLIITQSNVKDLELITDGVVILAEDIDMNNVSNYGDQRLGKKYQDYLFKGTFDGRGYTIYNYKTSSMSYAGSLIWSTSGATIKNIIFKDAIIKRYNSVLVGRTNSFTSFSNIAIEVSEMYMENAGAISGPGGDGLKYTDCLVYVHKNSKADIVYSGFINGLYCQGSSLSNTYFVSSTDLPIAPSGYLGITAPDFNIDSYKLMNPLEAKALLNKVDDETGKPFDWGTPLLNKAAELFFDGIVENDDGSITVEVGDAESFSAVLHDVKYSNATIVLTQDITLSGVWAINSVNFAGTLDGKGHVVSNFSIANSLREDDPTKYLNKGCMFASLAQGATIKDIAFKNVHVDGLKNVFTDSNIRADISFENVVMDVESVDNINLAGYKFSMLGYQERNTIRLTNVIIKSPVTTQSSGFITHYIAANQQIDNVICIGSLGLHSSTGNYDKGDGVFNPTPTYTSESGAAIVENTDYFIFNNEYSLFSESSELLPADLKALFDKTYDFDENNAIEINKQNIKEVLANATTGLYVLTEDIDMEGTAWTPMSTFSGVLDGKGHTISNLSLSSGQALFNNINGAIIKNIAFTNITTSGINSLFSIGNMTSDVSLKDVVIEFTSVTTSNAPNFKFATFSSQTGGTINLDDVIIIQHRTDSNRIGFVTSGSYNSQKYNKVIFIGGCGVHSLIDKTHADKVPEPNGETDTNYVICADKATALESSIYLTISENVKNLYN